MKMQTQYPLLAISLMLMFASCTSDPNSPGIEYMPDMYRSPAVEAYVDYGEDPYYVTEEFASTQRNTMSARLPAAGSIAYKGDDKAFALPYPYPNTPEGYEAAGVNLHSPLVTSDENTAAERSSSLRCVHNVMVRKEKVMVPFPEMVISLAFLTMPLNLKT